MAFRTSVKRVELRSAIYSVRYAMNKKIIIKWFEIRRNKKVNTVYNVY